MASFDGVVTGLTMPIHSELRVHGVSGAPPRAILYTDPVTSDPDDDYTRVYRRRRPDQTTTPDGTTVTFEAKAFHWGGLTSGHWITAFWMLLSPFAFANVAGWMTTTRSRFSHLTIRLAGLGLTCLFVVQMGYVFLEIPSVLGWTTGWLTLMVCSYIIFIVGFVILRLSTQSHFSASTTWADRIRMTFHPSPRFMTPPELWDTAMIAAEAWEDPAGAQLEDPIMWRPHTITGRIRRLHLASALMVLSLVLSVGIEAWSVRNFSVGLGLVVALLTVLTTFAPEWFITRLATAWAPLAGISILAWALWEVVSTGAPRGGWPDINIVTFDVSLVLGAFAAATLASGLRSLGAIGLGALFGGSLGIGAALILESLGGLNLITGEGAGWVAVAMLGLILTLLVAAGIMSMVPIDDALPARGKLMAALRRITRRGHWMFIIAAIYSLAAGTIAFVAGCVPGEGVMCDPSDLSVPDSWGMVVTVAIWLIILIPTGFILRSLAVSVVTRSSSRHVGILWDLASFWPRWFHPLAPPAYGPKIVGDLRRQLEDDPPDLLEAHSQGSVIAAATLAQMEAIPDLAAITYGSPLGILYRRLFPTTGVDELVKAVDRRLHARWRNLWRATDPLGGEPVGIGERDIPTATGVGHAGYEATGEFKRARLELLANGQRDTHRKPI